MSNEHEAKMDDAAARAAREASEQAVQHARELATDAVDTIRGLDQPRLFYLCALAVVVVATLVFDMAGFKVDSNGPVSETQAAAERFAEARLNSWAYSAFSSCIWGKLMWVASLAGIAIVVWSSMTKSAAAWVPLAEVGCAIVAVLMMALLWFVAFPDLSGYENADSHATLFGFWLPLAAAGFAAFISATRILKAA